MRKNFLGIIKKHLLTEYAIPIKQYKSRIDGLRLQLVENWCLCKYCQLFKPDSENFTHWINELRAHMDNIKSLNIKSGNKCKILKSMLIDDFDFDDNGTIYRIIVGKFKREGINDVNVISKITTEFTNNIELFINVLGIDDIITDDYLESEFRT